MKVKQEKPTFKPITITIESAQELCDLWHRFNLSADLVAYEGETDLEYGPIDDDIFFEEIDNIVKELNLHIKK